MRTLDLALLDDGPATRERLAAELDSAVRESGAVRLANHGLDTELIELSQVFGRRWLAHLELRELLEEHRSAMLGISQRMLGLAGIALGRGPSHFVDRHTGAPRVELTVESALHPGPVSTRGLLSLRQDVSGEVVASVGAQLARVSRGAYPVLDLRDAWPTRSALRLDVASSTQGVPGRAERPPRGEVSAHVDMTRIQYAAHQPTP
ncbi:MAG: hypothetical protein ABW136_13015 [Steroidobacteraceae bacterium]